MTDLGYATREMIRVSFYDQFVAITRYKDERYPPVWGYWDLSGPVAHLIEMGRGEPPARLFPPSA